MPEVTMSGAALRADLEQERARQFLYKDSREHFTTFLHTMWPQVKGPKPYTISHFHDFLADKVEATLLGTGPSRLAVSVPPQHGKEIDDDCPVWVRRAVKNVWHNTFIRHGDLVAGDWVYHPCGRWVRVARIIPQPQPCDMEVTLENGEKIKCHSKHEWTIRLSNPKLGKEERFTYETRQLAKIMAKEGTQDLPIVRGTHAKVHRHRIVAIRELKKAERVPGQCIEVEARDGLYCVSESMVPTHNSNLISIRAMAWLIGAQPGVRVVLTGFSYSLLVGFLYSLQLVTESETYREIFPDCQVEPTGNRKNNKIYTNGSSVLIKSSGMKLTGLPVDVLIIDDPHPGREEAESEVQRDKVIRWYNGDCQTRLAPGGRIFLIQTRWHPHDLIGHVTSEEYNLELELQGQLEQKFELINLKAIAEGDDPLGRPEGAVLFPEVRNLKFINGLKAALPSYEFSSQYQGVPKISGGGQIDLTKFRRVHLSDVPEGCEVFQGWDLALTERTSSDYTAGPLCAYHPDSDTLYVLDLFHAKKAWTFMKGEIVRLALLYKEEFDLTRIGMEAVAGFEIGFQELRTALLGEVILQRKNPGTQDKLTRAQLWLAKAEAGKIAIVHGAWNRKFLDEIEVFPKGAHDDIVDGMSVCAEMVWKRNKMLMA